MNSELLNYFKGNELAANVWQGKYALEGEATPDDMHKRMAAEFARIEEAYVEDEKEDGVDNPSVWNKLSFYGRHRKDLNEDLIYELFENFKYIIPQGSGMSGIGNPLPVSLSNCFVIGQPYDSYGGIFQKDEEQAQLMKRRGGVGQDLSTIRPNTAPVRNSARSSTGLVSFAKRYSNTTREVAQDGRRGALMLSCDIRHPDSPEFISSKQDLEQLTGANISVMLRDDFMKAVVNDEDYILRFPCEAELPWEFAPEHLEYNVLTGMLERDTNNKIFVKRVKAKELYNQIVHNAWSNAEPGQIFIDKHWELSPDTVYPKFKGVTTNPCGEIFMGSYDACRLMAMNFFSMVEKPFTEDAKVNYELVYQIAYEQQRLADDLVDLELEKINQILEKIAFDPEPEEVKRTEKELWMKVYLTAKASRRTGCGFTGLGDMIAALGLKYDSEESMEVITKVMKTKHLAEQDCSIDLAILRGPFEGWSKHREYTLEQNGDEDNVLIGKNPYYQRFYEEFPTIAKRMYAYGRRNVSTSTVAPTGTVSLVAELSSGIEPVFMVFHTRRKKINPGDENVRVDFVDGTGDSWQEYGVLHPNFREWIKSVHCYDDSALQNFGEAKLQELFEASPWYGSQAPDIDWIKRVQLQGIVQRYTTHSISSTINLPKDVKEEEVAQIYMKAWEEGLKGVTVYREGSRTGVLVSDDEKKSIKATDFEYVDAPKRPPTVPCEIHHTQVGDQKYTVLVGFLAGKPFEVFVLPMNIAVNYKTGFIRKEKSGVYNLIVSLDDSIPFKSNITEGLSDSEDAMTRLISGALRHRMDIKFIVEQLNKTHGDMFSFSKVMGRILKKYIPEGAESTIKQLESCTSPGQCKIIYEEGCVKCATCGNSKC